MNTKIIRSDKRKKTGSARLVGDVLEITVPAHIHGDELQKIVARFQQRIAYEEKKKQFDDAELERIAIQFNSQYFENKLTWKSIQWSTRQNSMWGICNPRRKTIHITYRVATMPQYVRDYLVMHELAHLLEHGHGAGFRKWVFRYPHAKQARKYIRECEKKSYYLKPLIEILNARAKSLQSAGL